MVRLRELQIGQAFKLPGETGQDYWEYQGDGWFSLPNGCNLRHLEDTEVIVPDCGYDAEFRCGDAPILCKWEVAKIFHFMRPGETWTHPNGESTTRIR